MIMVAQLLLLIITTMIMSVAFSLSDSWMVSTLTKWAAAACFVMQLLLFIDKLLKLYYPLPY